ncbi:ring-cleaving dioxygenase [Neptunitalea chrysea]|uniref:Ring-cleaving dioxygenase n=1 Tax=Neptunitalea chrysea TaxID=1647581 RepID=A0A9W6EUQ5_9FLAO|nr:VOC family protein [Neptunitalea chrysea]GLB53795.1 ring-cleaving dioxygenase [Neptunitalea chrysea]
MEAQFHLALPCERIEATKAFYINTIGATQGRQTNKWIDINLFNHQLTFTESGSFNFKFKNYKLDDNILPSFHFGVIVSIEIWGTLYKKLLQSNQEVTTKATFMENKVGEHLSFFITDPNGYMIEFKSFKDKGEVFTS